MKTAPMLAELHIIVIAYHTYGSYVVANQLDAVAMKAGKKIVRHVWSSGDFEDRKKYVNKAEVLRPSSLSADPLVRAYTSKLVGKWTSVLRAPTAMPTTGIFFSPQTRDVLEAEFLRVGCELLARCQHSLASMRPLGFSRMPTLGFGAVFMNYRNCPNNAPLVMWWSAPTADGNAWYPLMPRRSSATVVTTAALIDRLKRIAAKKKAPLTPQPPPAILVESDPDAVGHWEVAARNAVSHVLDQVEFEPSEGVARVPEESDYREFTDRETLEHYLAEVYDEAWCANVPFDGGEAVFESDGIWRVIEFLEERFPNELSIMGWD